jgi:lipoprotein-anchoring transpeptidase ErfK/SrfK
MWRRLAERWRQCGHSPLASTNFGDIWMRRHFLALAGVVALMGATVTSAQAYEIDILTRQPLVVGPGGGRPQASAIPRETVSYSGRYGAGTIVISTAERRLYYVLGDGTAIRYGVGVGRPGFEWGGVKAITRKAEWPGWTPPPQMLKRMTNDDVVDLYDRVRVGTRVVVQR